MSAYLHVLRLWLFSLAVLGAIGAETSPGAQTVTVDETVRSVRRMLERLRTTASSTTSSSEWTAAPCTSPATASKEG